QLRNTVFGIFHDFHHLTRGPRRTNSKLLANQALQVILHVRSSQGLREPFSRQPRQFARGLDRARAARGHGLNRNPQLRAYHVAPAALLPSANLNQLPARSVRHRVLQKLSTPQNIHQPKNSLECTVQPFFARVAHSRDVWSAELTFVVNESCIRCKTMDCVAVCPVDCFYEGENMLVIHPDECIDCGVCEPECPVDAITADTEPGREKWLSLNAEYAKIWPNIAVKK